MYFGLDNKRFKYAEFSKYFNVVNTKKANVITYSDGKYEIISASKYNNGIYKGVV